MLAYLVYGPWKDPNGYNFPQTITFDAVTKIPRLFDGLRANAGSLIALAAVLLAASGLGFLLLRRHRLRLIAATVVPGAPLPGAPGELTADQRARLEQALEELES